ncbi:MAG: hypothetical protein EOM50_08785 [Erysipelotrichia bacterium]|nr:hypothetical protein [Erysipelotrichia bacterium]
MSNYEENNLANLFLDISKKLSENFFDYIYNDKHNKLISDIAWKIHKTFVDENLDTEKNYFGTNNPESLIVDIFQSMIKEGGHNYSFDLSSFQNIQLLHNALNQISVQLFNQDYNIATPHDYSNIINDYKSQRINNNQRNLKYHDFIDKQSSENYKKPVKRSAEVVSF